MKTITSSLGAFLALICSSAHAGHHFETKLAQENPQYDTQDVYVFQAPEGQAPEGQAPEGQASEGKKTVFVMTFNPQGKAGDTTTFGNDGLYHFHIGEDAAMTKGETLTFQFTGDEVRAFLSQEAFPEPGVTGELLGISKISEVKDCEKGIRFWVDTVHDPFTGNGAALGAFKQGVNEGKFNPKAFSDHPGDLFGESVCGGIVFEVPNAHLPKTLYYCASTSKNLGEDHWHRINRIGHVLLPHLYMEGNENLTSYNGGTIVEDATRRPLAVATIKKFATAAGAQKDPEVYAEKIAEMLLPDAVPYTTGTEATYSLPKINGRKLSDNAMDTAMEMLVGKPFPAHSGEPKKFRVTFPYLISAK
ncbi:MAG: DUF4331 family protein [Verrucomicrobiales bacterium]